MQFDTESIKARITNSLRSKASWAEILMFSTNSRIIDAVAENIAQLASYDEFLTRNTRWDLATEKSALVTQARFRGYDPHRKIGARGNIRVSADSSFASPPSDIVPIPQYSVFSDGGDLKFTAIQNENLLTSDNYIDIPVVQGEPKSYTHVAQGDNYEQISITNDSVENEYYKVTVNGVEWTEVDDLNASDSADEVYEFETTLNFDGVTVKFGNDVFGKKLQTGDTVIIYYVETLGIEGNVVATSLITSVESSFYTEGGDPITLFCTNTAALDGGSDEETLEEIRTNGIDTFQAGEKAVVQKDYEVKLQAHPYVQKATVWGAYEYNLDNNLDLWTWIETLENVVYVSAFTPAGEQLTEDQKITLIEYLKEDKPPTDIVRFVDAEFVEIALNSDIFVRDTSYVLSEVKANFISKFTTDYSLTNIDFKQSLYDTEWKGALNTVGGVTYHSSYIQVIFYPTFNSAYIGDLDAPTYPIEKESMSIYIKDLTAASPEYVLVGTDDGLGGFVAESPYDLTGSSINYDTGEGVLSVISGLTKDYSSYAIKVYFEVSSLNIDLKERNQIFKIAETDNITANYTTS